MSTDWNIYCIDCNQEHYFCDANHQLELMYEIIKAAPGLAALGEFWPIKYNIKLKSSYGQINPLFFKKHKGHRLVPRSEYGEIDQFCAEYIRCECGSGYYCVLAKGHEGHHSRTR